MQRRGTILLNCITAFFMLFLLVFGLSELRTNRQGARFQAGSPAGHSSRDVTLISAPLVFEPNLGQFDPSVRFGSRGRGYNLFLTSSGAVLDLYREEPFAQLHAAGSTTHRAIRMSMPGANPSKLEGLKRYPGKSQYLMGSDPRGWVTEVPRFLAVRYKGIYPGIDMVYYGKERLLEYDFEVAPGADPSLIRLKFDGVDGVRLEENGDLVLGWPTGEATLMAPRLYQFKQGRETPVSGRFVLTGAREVAFDLGEYDRDNRLIIDPALLYSTYLGSTANDNGNAVAVNSSGSFVVAGRTESSKFPTTVGGAHRGGSDVFVTRFGPDNLPIYSTFLGGSQSDGASGIAIDPDGNVYVVGGTSSTNFPTTSGAYQRTAVGSEGFISKLNPAGNALVYSTFLGGRGSDSVTGIAVDSSGNVFVTGETTSSNFPTLKAFQGTMRGNSDTFVARLNSTGSSLVYSSYLGGTNGFLERASGIGIDAAGNAYVAGYLSGSNVTDFPLKNAMQGNMKGQSEGFVTAVDTGGALIYSTFLGSTVEDKINAIAVDATGNVYAGGWALEWSSSFVTTPNVFQAKGLGWGEGFLSKIKPDGSGLVFSTYVSGTDFDQISGLAVDPSGDVYGIGYAGSGFPMISAVQSGVGGGWVDAHVFRLKADGSDLLFSTYLGGSGREEGNAIAVDGQGCAYVTGITESLNFPTVQPYQTAHGDDGGLTDAFVAKIDTNTTASTGTSLGPIAGLGWTRFIKVDKDGDDLPDELDNVVGVLREGRRLRFSSSSFPGDEEAGTIELSNPHPVGGFYQTARKCSQDESGGFWTLMGTIDGYDNNLRPMSARVTETIERTGLPLSVKSGSAALSDANGDGIVDTITVRWPEQPAVNINLVSIDVNADGKGDFLTIPWTMSQWIGVNKGDLQADPRVFLPIGDTNGDGTPDSLAFDFDNDGKPDPDLPSVPQVAGTALSPPPDAHQLYFAQFADGGGLFSQIMLFNLDSTSAANATVTTRDDEGRLLPVDFNGQQSDGTHGVVVPAGGLVVLSTDGAGPVAAGSVTVACDRVIAGVVLFGGPFGVAGVGSSFPQVEGFAAPMENNTAQGVTPGIAVMNLTGEAATLNLELCSTENAQLATATLPLAGNGHAARYLSEFSWTPAVDLQDFKGILRITSDRKIAGSVLQQRSQQSEFATMPVLDHWKSPPQTAKLAVSGAKDNRLFFSQFADGGGLFSQIMLFNLNFQNPAHATLNLRTGGGSPLAVDLNGQNITGTTDVTVPAGGLAILKTDGQGAIAVGSVVVSSDQPLAGVILFGGGFGVAGVGSSAELFNGFVAPMECRPGGGVNTGVAMMNLETTSTVVNLELLNEGAQVVATASVEVPGNGHVAVYVNEFQWSAAADLSNFKGLLRASSSGKIAALALQTRQAAVAQFATIPVAPRIN